jgi:hypothetical protein
MNPEASHLYRLIKQYVLDWRHPDLLARVVRRLEKDKLSQSQVRRWMRKIKPWIEEQVLKQNYLPCPPDPQAFGTEQKPFDLSLGFLSERPEVPFGVNVSEGVHHAIIVGKPGSGKTVTLKVYISKIIEFNQQNPEDPILIIFFDSKKDIPNPHKLLGENTLHLTVHDPNSLPLGLNPPQGVPLSEWASSLSMVLAARLGLIVSRTLLTSVFQWAAAQLNSNGADSTPPITPSLSLILDILNNSPISLWSEKADYTGTLVQALSGLISDSKGLFETERGFDITADCLAKQKHCVIDIFNCEPPYLRYLICEILLLQLLLYVMHNHKKTTRTRICLIFDEADFFVRPEAQAVYPQSLSIITLCARLFREYGIQVIISVSGLQNVAPYLLTGADCHIIHQSTDAESIWMTQKTLGIERGLEKLQPSLIPGQAIIRYASCLFPYPFLGQMHLIEPDHSRQSRPFDKIPFTPARRLDDVPELKKALENLIQQHNHQFAEKKNKKAKAALNQSERHFLDLMSIYEFELLHWLFARMDDISPATQQKILKRLEKLEFIETEPIRAGKSTIRFGIIADKGWEFLGKQPQYKKTRGGPAHRCLCHYQMQIDLKHGAIQSGCDLEIPGSSGCTDVLTKKADGYHCNEIIVHCENNILKHARDCFESKQVQSLTCITCLKSDHEDISQQIINDPDLTFHISKIHFMTIEKLIHLYKETL